MELFGNQAAFLEDYHRIVKGADKRFDEEIITETNNILPTAANYQLVIGAEQTEFGERICFPFKQEICSTDTDGTVTSRFVYIGSPFKLGTKFDEQQ